MNETNNENEDQDILFPLESIEQKAMLRKKTGLSVLRVFLFCALLAGVFLLGFGTRPEVMSQWVDEGKKWMQVGIEKIKPIADKMYGKTVEMVDKVHSSTAQPASSAAVNKKLGRKIKHWRAPMNPGFISDRPGKGPMGMALVPVYEDEV